MVSISDVVEIINKHKFPYKAAGGTKYAINVNVLIAELNKSEQETLSEHL